MSTGWTSRYALRTKSITSSQIRELLKVTQKPGMISFGGGLPAPDVFPVQRFEEACHKVLTEQAASALQYGETEGYRPLRELIANNMARYGIKAKVENVLITSGSQQALDLIGKLFINAGDRVLVEAPTYLGALQAFNVYGAEYVSVPIDENGLRTDLLEKPLRSGPKFMYVLPNFQNPAGTTLSEGRRHELVMLADKYGIPIIEDDPYGQLRYEGEHLPSLVVLDRENLRRDNGYSIGNVIYLSTFSKTLAPGLRLGWIVAPPEVISKLTQLKQGADLHTSTFTQFVAYEVARDGFLDKHVKLIRKIYGERRDVMLQALQEFFPPEVTWTHPQGRPIPLGNSARRDWTCRPFSNRQSSRTWRSSPAIPSMPTILQEGSRHMRLNFSNAAPEQIREGIRRLAAAVKSHLTATTLRLKLPLEV